jgi:hypothetical protein
MSKVPWHITMSPDGFIPQQLRDGDRDQPGVQL